MSSQQGKSVLKNFYEPSLMGTGRGMNADNQSVNKYMDLYNMYWDRLSELCMNRFHWEGMPDSVDVRFMEMTLFRMGLSVFYWEERYDQYMAMRATPAGQWNMYDNPTHFQVNGNSFINRLVDTSNAVPIWANANRRPDTNIVNIYASKLADLDMSLEINAHNARRGKVIAVNENQKLSAANYVNQIDRGDPVIMVNKKVFDPNDGSLTALDLGVDPDSLINLHMFRTRIWSEAMGLLGIDNANQDKKERLVSAEVTSNDGQTDNMRRVNLNAREAACDAINKRWPNLDVSVSYWVDEASDGPELAGNEPGADTETSTADDKETV